MAKMLRLRNLRTSEIWSFIVYAELYIVLSLDVINQYDGSGGWQWNLVVKCAVTTHALPLQSSPWPTFLEHCKRHVVILEASYIFSPRMRPWIIPPSLQKSYSFSFLPFFTVSAGDISPSAPRISSLGHRFFMPATKKTLNTSAFITGNLMRWDRAQQISWHRYYFSLFQDASKFGFKLVGWRYMLGTRRYDVSNEISNVRIVSIMLSSRKFNMGR